jgi:serine/threonine-protein kinase RsbT
LLILANDARRLFQGKSLGLGLPGAKRLMDEFEMASEVSKGTTITMPK